MPRNDYKWDGNSRDERHSEFAHSGYATTTTTSAGALHSSWGPEHGARRIRPGKPHRSRASGLLWPIVIAVGASAGVLVAVVVHWRG